MKIKSPIIIIQLIIISSVLAQEHVHWDVVQKIREEGIHHSHIMEDVGWLTDVFGPRLSGSPSYFAAAKWVKGKLEAYGLENVRLEPYAFGTGWQNDFTSVHMVSPQYMPIIDFPWIVEQLNANGYQGDFALEYELYTMKAEVGLKKFYNDFVGLFDKRVNES